MAPRDPLASQISREVHTKIRRDAEVGRKAKREADQIRAFILRRTPGSGRENVGVHADCKHEEPYATGDFRKSIHLERRRDRFGLPHWWLGSDHPHVNLLEYGTGPDNPSSESPWGPNTPTPEFGMFAQTAARFGGTTD